MSHGQAGCAPSTKAASRMMMLGEQGKGRGKEGGCTKNKFVKGKIENQLRCSCDGEKIGVYSWERNGYGCFRTGGNIGEKGLNEDKGKEDYKGVRKRENNDTLERVRK